MADRALAVLEGISKRFGSIQALDDATLEIKAGEILVLAGENGAGKTSLMNVLTGLYRPDKGRIFVEGRPYDIRGPRDAIKLGLAMVHQHFELVYNFTVLENIILGLEGAGARLDWDAHREKVGNLASRYGLQVSLDQRVRDLPVGLQQKVEILKALYRQARLLILDEPTTLLTPQEVDSLFKTIRKLAQSGVGIVLVTHKLREAFQVSDRIAVMRRGRVVGSLPTAQATPEKIVEMLMGTPEASKLVSPQYELPTISTHAQPLLHIEDLWLETRTGPPLLKAISLSVRKGEILGLAGVAGNGQSELVETLIGLRLPTRGIIALAGQDVTALTTSERIRTGLVLIPEDRIRDGMLPHHTIAENMVLGLHHLVFRHRFRRDHAIRLANLAISNYDVRAPDPSAEAATLSGGNIQKMVVARAMVMAERHEEPVLIAFNPTRGLDIRATDFVRKEIVNVGFRGGAVLLLSEDLDELMALSHRICVLHRGELVAEFTGPSYDPYKIGDAMIGSLGAASREGD
jgi:ABC-type uncharacterized transport system ATPase subunit